MKTLINLKDLSQQTLTYQELLLNNLFFEAHETLEELWFPLRFEKNDEIRLIRAYINAAVSFELVKRGREKSGLKPWSFFQKNKNLIHNTPIEHQDFYQKIVLSIMQTQKRLNCFQGDLLL